MAQWLKNILLNTLLVFVSTMFGLALIEIGLRFTRFADLPDQNHDYPPYYFKADTELGYDIDKNTNVKVHNLSEHPYEIFSNEYGCFDKNREVPDDYALIVGDSQTWGYAPLDKKWTSRLEEFSNYFMLKCGVTGYGTLQELNKAKRVVKHVGKPPTHIIVLYIGNDFNDDYLFPQRTVYQGNLVTSIDNLDLDTGNIYRRSQKDIERIYARYKENTLSNKLMKWVEGLVTFRLYRNKRGELRGFFKELFSQDEKVTSDNHKLSTVDTQRPSTTDTQALADRDSTTPTGIGRKVHAGTLKPDPNADLSLLPSGMTGPSVYKVTLSAYLDTYDRSWFNQALEQHQRNLFNFIDYADSIGARLLLIDSNGTLLHPRHQALISSFDNSNSHSYYNLSSDYKQILTWQYDGHWNIEGNELAARHIYKQIKTLEFLP